MPISRKLGRGVAMVGAGMSRFGAFAEKNSRDLFVEAFKQMKKSVDKEFDPSLIETLYIGNFSSDQFEHQAHIAPILTDAVGLLPRPATRVEDACASGGVALRQGMMAIASGMYDMVLVGGAEKMSALNTAAVTEALATAADVAYEIPAGFTFPGFYAAMASAYMHRYGMKSEHLMNVAIKNHDNASLNPNAQFGVTIQNWMEDASHRRSKGGSRNRPGRPSGIFSTTNQATRQLRGRFDYSTAPRSRTVLPRSCSLLKNAHMSLPIIQFTLSVLVRHQTLHCMIVPS